MSNINCSLSAIVLAGGKSSRMGRDKALIEIEGVPLIQRTIQIAQSLSDRTYVVTSTPDKYRLYLSGCEVVEEVEPQGALIGFATALAEIESEWVLLLACDLPRLKLEPLQGWKSQLAYILPDEIAYLARSDKGWEPLCGFYRCSSLADLPGYIASGGRSFQKWLERHHVAEVAVKDSDILFNCNNPIDLDFILQNSTQD